MFDTCEKYRAQRVMAYPTGHGLANGCSIALIIDNLGMQMVRQLFQLFSESVISFSGWLIHATVGSAGGVGTL